MPQTYDLPPAPPHNHGGTVAAWTLMAGVIVGAIIAAIGLAMSSAVAIIIGVVVIVVALVLGLVLRGAGLGQKKKAAAAAR